MGQDPIGWRHGTGGAATAGIGTGEPAGFWLVPLARCLYVRSGSGEGRRNARTHLLAPRQRRLSPVGVLGFEDKRTRDAAPGGRHAALDFSKPDLDRRRGDDALPLLKLVLPHRAALERGLRSRLVAALLGLSSDGDRSNHAGIVMSSTSIAAIGSNLMAEGKDAEDHTEQEWEIASDRVEAIRERVLAHPIAAAAEHRKYSEITRRVLNLPYARRED